MDLCQVMPCIWARHPVKADNTIPLDCLEWKELALLQSGVVCGGCSKTIHQYGVDVRQLGVWPECLVHGSGKTQCQSLGV